MTRESLDGGPEGPLYEAVEMKPELHWRPQDVGKCQSHGILAKESCGPG